MSNDPAADKQLTGTVGYSRKVNDGNYGAAEVSHFVQYDIVEDGATTVTNRDKALAAAKALVMDGLVEFGVGYEVDGTVVTEQRDPAPKANVADDAADIIQNATGASTATSEDGTQAPRTKVAKKDREWVEENPVPSWFTREYVASQGGDPNETFWDNRQGAQGTRRPHFKGVDSEKAIWPPKD